jgi:hypothetical protein
MKMAMGNGGSAAGASLAALVEEVARCNSYPLLLFREVRRADLPCLTGTRRASMRSKSIPFDVDRFRPQSPARGRRLGLSINMASACLEYNIISLIGGAQSGTGIFPQAHRCLQQAGPDYWRHDLLWWGYLTARRTQQKDWRWRVTGRSPRTPWKHQETGFWLLKR